MKKLVLLCIGGMIIMSCQKDDDTNTATVPSNVISASTKSYSGEFVQDYFNLSCKVIKYSSGHFPTHAARAYGYIGITAYETARHGIAGAQSLEGQIQGFDPGALPSPEEGRVYNWAIAVNAATARIMQRMFEGDINEDYQAQINAMHDANKSNLEMGVAQDVVLRSEGFGFAVAEAVYEMSKSDGGHKAYEDPFNLVNDPFTWPSDPYCWVPTGAALKPLSPYWGENRNFVFGLVPECQPEAHMLFSSEPGSAFHDAALEVYEQVTIHNTDEEETITKYWADDPFMTCTPAGHTFNMLSQLLRENGASLEKTVVAYGMLGIAESEAFIACWKTKYDYMLIRPVSFIQQYIDPNFQTVIGTPPFPAYTSGHATEVGAGAKVFIHLFAESNGAYAFTDLSQTQYGFSPRNFDNFYDMADECAKSRFYGGIHYTFDNDLGLDMGFAVGDAVLNDISWPSNIE